MALATQIYPHVRDVRAEKSVTFTDTAGNGATGTVAIFNVTGSVLVSWMYAVCTVDLVGASSVSLGTAGDVDGFIAATTGTDIDAGEVWTAASPAAGSKSPLVVNTGGLVTSQGPKFVRENIIMTVSSAAVSAGAMTFIAVWTPLSSDGLLVAA